MKRGDRYEAAYRSKGNINVMASSRNAMSNFTQQNVKMLPPLDYFEHRST